MKKYSFISAIFLLLVSCNKTVDVPTSYIPVYPGIWNVKIGIPEEVNLLSNLTTLPREEVLNKKEALSLPINMEEVKSEIINGRTFLRFPLDKDEQIFGLGLNFKSIDQRGRILRLHNDHYGAGDNGRTHAAVPFFVSSKGYGVFINSARYIDAYIGTGVRVDSKNPPEVMDRNTRGDWNSAPYSDNIEFVVPANGVELVFFAGKDMLDVVSKFNLYCGGGFIPPKWGLGFWHRTPTLFTENDVKKEVAGFKEKGFPLDVVGLEPGWHSFAYPCSFEWDETRFPNPEKFVHSMDSTNLKVNLWCNPYIAPKSKLYNEILPYVGSHTVWCGVVPDFTVNQARELFQNHIKKNQLDMGVSGYKIDEVDGFDTWLWPDVATFPSGISGEVMRSIYGTLTMDVIDEVYKKNNTRTYGLVRASNAGGVSHPYVIYNDNYSHRDFITAISNSSFIGVMWTPEVRSSQTSEEWLRRMQTTCFAPIAMLNAWADGTKPWSYPDVYDECKNAAVQRMQILPYLYSVFAQYYLEGVPPYRAMNLDSGYSIKTQKIKTELDATDNPYETMIVKEVKDQFMVGNDIIVAPIFAGDKSRDVVLPKGKWYDYYTGKYIGEDQIITIDAEMDKLPLFVRDGGMIPTIPPVLNTSEWRKGQVLEVRVYGDADGHFDVYDDDGSSYDYTKGEYCIKRLKRVNGQCSVETLKDQGDNWSYTDVVFKQISL